MAQSQYGFRVFPYQSKNGVVVRWNAVIYDLRYPSADNMRNEVTYPFVKLVGPCDSIEAMRTEATRTIRTMLGF